MKTLRRSIKFVLVFVVLILIALLAFVATFDANNYKPQIIAQVEKATGRDFTIDGDIDLALFPWVGLKVEDATLGNEKGFIAKQFAAIKQLDIKMNVLPLLKKEVEINTIRLHGLNIFLEVAENKTSNWSSLGQPDAASGDASRAGKTAEPPADKAVSDKKAVSALQSLKVEGIELVDAQIHYEDRSSNTKATISELNLKTGSIQFDQAVDVRFSARVENNQPAIDAHLNLITQLTFNKDFTEFNLRDFVFTVLADANEFIKQKEQLEIKTSIDVSMEDQRVVLKQLQLSALGTTTLADINVSQFLQTPLIQGDIEVQSFNARQVAKRVGVQLPAMAKADALHQVALKTKIKLHGEKLEANDFSLSVDGSVLSGWLHLINLSKQQLRYDLAFDQLNINDYLPPVVEAAVNDKAERSLAAAKVKTSTDKPDALAAGDEKIELPLKMMRQLDVQGDFRIASLQVREYLARQFLMTTKAQQGEINIKPLSMQVLDGQVTSAVKINVKKAIPAYVIKLDVNQVQVGPVVNPFLDGLMGEKPLTMKGAANLALDVKTKGETVNQLKKASSGKVILNMNETEVKGFDPEFYMRSSIADYVDTKGFSLSKNIMGNYNPREVTVFDKIYSTVNLADGKARTDDFLMDSKRVQVTARGQVNIMQNTVDVISSVKLPRGKTSLEKVLDEPLYVRVHGPFNALAYDIDTDRLKKSTTDVLKNEAKAKLDAEKQRLKAEAEEKAKEELKKSTDELKDKLKDKLKGLF
jgi:AsmA protein